MSELKITSRTRLYAIIGDPIGHSLSPVMQNAAFEAIGLDAAYLALRVEPSKLREAVEGFRAVSISGFNVTIPHKVAIMKYLDELDASAATIGATNTVVNHDGKLVGHNTDGAGALAALREAKFDPRDKRVVLLGAGGAARALAFSLAEGAERLAILNRTASRARSLAEDVQRVTGAIVTSGCLDSPTLSKELAFADLLVNATSVGMNPRPEETPVDARRIDFGNMIKVMELAKN